MSHIKYFFSVSVLVLSVVRALAVSSSFDTPIQPQQDAFFNSLITEVESDYQARDIAFSAALLNADSLNAYRQRTQQSVASSIALSPLDVHECTDAQVKGKRRYALFTVWNVLLNGSITANLYFPNKVATDKTVPFVYFIPGHEALGKSTNDYQLCAQLFAAHGIACLVADPIGQGERQQLLYENDQPLFPRATQQHSVLLSSSLLVGNSIVKRELLDNLICVDFAWRAQQLMPQLPIVVDKQRIGVIGNSGGGAQTSYLCAFERRLQAICVCSWVTSRPMMYRKYGPDDGCQFTVGEAHKGVDIADMLLIQAPKPMLILAGKHDFILYKGTAKAVADLKKAYKTLGTPDNVTLFADNDKHGISRSKRAEALRFFRRSFNMSVDTLHSEDGLRLRPLQDSLLRFYVATYDNANANIALKNQQLFDSFADSRTRFAAKPTNIQRMVIAGMLNLPNYTPKINNPRLANLNVPARQLLETDSMPCPARMAFNDATLRIYGLLDAKGQIDSLQPILYRVEPQGYQETKANGASPNAILLISDSGYVSATARRIINASLKANAAVYLCDLPAAATLRDDPQAQNKKFMDNQYRVASLALLTSRTVLSRQTEQLLAVMDALPHNMNVISIGATNVAALHALFLDGRVPAACLVELNPTTDWEELIKQPYTENALLTIQPDALKFYTLNELRNGFRKRKQDKEQTEVPNTTERTDTPKSSVRTTTKNGVTTRVYTIY